MTQHKFFRFTLRAIMALTHVTLPVKAVYIIILLGCVAPTMPARADLASVAAVHDYVKQYWDVEIPRGRADSNIITMNYIMQLVDRTNEKLNGFQTTNYANNTKYATSAIASDTAAKEAIDKLIAIVCPFDLTDAFCFIPATTSTTYSFLISAAGYYTIDWGDGEIETIEKSDTTATIYSHTYSNTAAKHRILLTGKATMYSTSDTTAAISFCDRNYPDAQSATSASTYGISSMTGCLGCIFSTIDNETIPTNQRQPRFYQTFMANFDLSGTIPQQIFAGIHGAPVSKMFDRTFSGAHQLTGTIPQNLFADLSGAPTSRLFTDTFRDCYNLIGPIPEDLFAGINGAPAYATFAGTFRSCTNLNGNIPSGLFSGIHGPLSSSMFEHLFTGCVSLTGEIPETLFSGISTSAPYASYSFNDTFYNCTSLYGPSAKIGDKYLYEIWPGVSPGGTYTNDKSLSDYECIPTGWGGAGTKPVGTCESTEQD